MTTKQNTKQNAAMEPRPDGRGKSLVAVKVDGGKREAAMEPRPDGRGKPGENRTTERTQRMPQWSPGLMAGGRK